MKRNNAGVIVTAAILILLGAAFFAFTAFNIRLTWYGGWWNFILMGLAVLSMVRNGPRFGNAFLLGSAVIMFARWQGFFVHSWWQMGTYMGALALVLLGCSLLWNLVRPRKEPPRQNDWIPSAPPPPQQEWEGSDAAPHSAETNPTRFALFSSETCRSDCKNLQGGKFTAIFGAVLVDLSQADFTRPIAIDIYNVFGGVDVITPNGVRVECAGTSVFGGCDARSVAGRPYDASHPTLTIRHTSVFGGVNVK